MRKLFIFIFLMLLSTTSISGLSFAVDTQANLTVGCDVINCSDGPLNLTIIAPDGTFLLTEQPITKGVGYAYYTIPSSNLSQTSTYQYFLASNNDDYSNTFEVRNSGKILTTSESILYVFFLLGVGAVIFLIIKLIQIIPTNNPTNVEGELTGVNYVKYLKVPLWALVYSMLMFAFYIISNVALTYLQDKFIGTFFFTAFQVMGYAAIPFLILTVWFMVVRIAADVMLGKDIKRGFLTNG